MKSVIQDAVMGMMDPLRAETIEHAEGDVLEVGFGTGRNLELYPSSVKSVTGLDPLAAENFQKLDDRIANVPFPVERCLLPADGQLPFDSGRFDTIVTTWTLCSIPDAGLALEQMRQVLRPGGRYIFVEHGRAEKSSTVRWQDRINPIWQRVCDGCNINRKIDRLVEDAGFELTSMDRFRAKGPSISAAMYRGIATRA